MSTTAELTQNSTTLAWPEFKAKYDNYIGGKFVPSTGTIFLCSSTGKFEQN